MPDSNDFTIADVARTAGVSVSTVSRILNGKQDVAASTRERVQQVIEQLGYRPHVQAQRLRAGKTRSIALLFPHKYPGNLPYDALEMDFIIGASTTAGEREFFFNLLTNSITRQNLLSLYRSAQVDGVVLMQIHTQDWRVDLLRQNGHPFVMIGHCDDNTGLSFIDLDFEAGVLTAFNYLVDLGHRTIGFIALPDVMRQQGYGPAVRSWQGYEQVLSKHGLKAAFREVKHIGQDIYDATLSLLDECPDLTAIVTTHDFGALSIVRALNTCGRSIPADCSIITLMTERIAELSTPPLTSLDFPSYMMGQKAVDMLIRTLEGEMPELEQILIPPRLVIRSSTASPT